MRVCYKVFRIIFQQCLFWKGFAHLSCWSYSWWISISRISWISKRTL